MLLSARRPPQQQKGGTPRATRMARAAAPAAHHCDPPRRVPARTTWPLLQLGSSQMLLAASVEKAIQSRLCADDRIPLHHFLHSASLASHHTAVKLTFKTKVYGIALPVRGSLSSMLLPPFPNGFTLSAQLQANLTIGYQPKRCYPGGRNTDKEKGDFMVKKELQCGCHLD